MAKTGCRLHGGVYRFERQLIYILTNKLLFSLVIQSLPEGNVRSFKVITGQFFSAAYDNVDE